MALKVSNLRVHEGMTLSGLKMLSYVWKFDSIAQLSVKALAETAQAYRW